MNRSSSSGVHLVILTIFAIAMGFLEAAIVVYLREILYPNGFAFPLAPISNKLAVIEFLREAATLIMLLAVGWMTGRTRFEKFILFLYAFAIWDIFYYIFLKILINWPASFLTWDILFLIPVTWTGPVLAPVTSSLSMIILSLFAVHFTNSDKGVFMRTGEWILLLAGALLQFIAFIWDYSCFILKNYSYNELWSFPVKKTLYSLSLNYIPVSFPWAIFLFGEMCILGAIFLFCRKYCR
jgi:hypothetical protein